MLKAIRNFLILCIITAIAIIGLSYKTDIIQDLFMNRSVLKEVDGIEGDVFKIDAIIKDMKESGDTTKDITALKISTDNTLVSAIKYVSPYINSNDTVSLYYDKNRNIFTKLEITTTSSSKEIEEEFNTIDSSLESIENSVDDSMSTVDQLLTIHDYFAVNFKYQSNEKESYHYTSTLLTDHTGVCDSYSYLYYYVLHDLGIECDVVISKEMNHSWNIVNVDGEYYHVDVTWDDPIYDQFGRASHANFLLSDEAISKDHYDWTCDETCESTKYDNYYWKNINSPILLYNNYHYYIREGKLYRKGSKETSLATLGTWMQSSNYYYNDSFSGLFIYNNYLYFNTPTSIYKMNLSNNSKTKIYSSSYQIFGIRYYNGKLQYNTGKPDGNNQNIIEINI